MKLFYLIYLSFRFSLKDTAGDLFGSKRDMGVEISLKKNSWEKTVHTKMFHSVILKQILCHFILSPFILKEAAPETPPTGGG